VNNEETVGVVNVTAPSEDMTLALLMPGFQCLYAQPAFTDFLRLHLHQRINNKTSNSAKEARMIPIKKYLEFIGEGFCLGGSIVCDSVGVASVEFGFVKGCGGVAWGLGLGGECFTGGPLPGGGSGIVAGGPGGPPIWGVTMSLFIVYQDGLKERRWLSFENFISRRWSSGPSLELELYNNWGVKPTLFPFGTVSFIPSRVYIIV